MAPEQFAREPMDGRTDQFSFAVSLYEALYRQRPFGDAGYEELRRAVCEGRVREPHAVEGVPALLHRALLRAMRKCREDRYPSMTALLSVLEEVLGDGAQRSASATPKKRGVAAVVGVFVVVGLAWFATSAARGTSARGDAPSISGSHQSASPLIAIRSRLDQAETLAKDGRVVEARAAVEDACRLAVDARDLTAEAEALGRLAALDAKAHRAEDAARALERRREILSTLEDREGIYGSLDREGKIWEQVGRATRAKACQERAVVVSRELADKAKEVAALAQLSAALCELALLDDARRVMDEALAITGMSPVEPKTVRILESVRGFIALERGELASAQALYEAELAHAREAGDKESELHALVTLGMVRSARGDMTAARALHDEWMTLALRSDVGGTRLGSLAALAVVLLDIEERRYVDAEGLARQIVDHITAERGPAAAAPARASLAWSLLEQDKYVAATEEIERARSSGREIDVVRMRMHIDTIGATVDGFSSDPVRAADGLSSITALSEKAEHDGLVEESLWARYARGRVEMRQRLAGGQATLRALEKDATQKGFLTVARLAAEARGAGRRGVRP
jgi:tetratricopeptide (TPR) repeat protein